MNIKKHNFKIQWIAFIILVGLFVFVAIYFEDKKWIANALQTIGTITGVYLTIIVFFQSKVGADKQFRDHVEHLQRLNKEYVEALYNATERQIKTFQETNTQKITALKEETDRQINALQELTEKQIEALNKTTYEQISSFENEIREFTNRLTDNSILLAEILGRELEKSIELYGNAIKNEEKKYSDLSNWKLLRTPAERESQLNTQWNRIQKIKNGYDYLLTKYNQVRNYLGLGIKQLNE